MTEMQKQFEEWAKENLGCDLSHNGEHYNHTWAYYAWKGWQASRAAIVVKLPETHNDWLDKQVVQYAIEAEGLKHE